MISIRLIALVMLSLVGMPASAEALGIALSTPGSMTLSPGATSTAVTSATVTSLIPWTLSASDTKSVNRGFMTPTDLLLGSGLCHATAPLSNAMTLTSARDPLDLGHPTNLVSGATLTGASGVQIASGTTTSVVAVSFAERIGSTEALAPSPPCKYSLTVQFTAVNP